MPEKMKKALYKRIKSDSPNVSTRDSAIAIAKSQGFLRQNGQSLNMTSKGRSAAKSAMSTLRSNGYSWNGSRWTKS